MSDLWTAPASVTTTSGTAGTASLVDDSGVATIYFNCHRYTLDKAANAWRATTQPSNCTLPSSADGFAGDASYLSMAANGTWITYNPGDNTMSRAGSEPLLPADYLLGFAKSWGSDRKALYARTGEGTHIGAHLARAEYDTLPTPTATSGIGRDRVYNLWAFFLK